MQFGVGGVGESGSSSSPLSWRLSRLGGELLVEVLHQIAKGKIVAQPQPEEGVSYAPKIEREEARINWSLPGERISCLIRAFDPVPGAFCLRSGSIFKLFRSIPGGSSTGKPGEIVGCNKKGIEISCGDSKTVIVREVQAEGKKRMSAGEYLLGARMEPGEVLD